MNPVLRSAIRELKADRGVVLDPLVDLEHILNLKVLADAVLRVQQDNRNRALLQPVMRVGPLEFRRLSVAAGDFISENVLKWWAADSDNVLISFAYCHAHQDRPELIWGYDGQKAAWTKTISAWRRALPVSWADLVWAVQGFQEAVSELDELLARVIGPAKHEADEGQEGGGSFGPLVDVLASQYCFTVPTGMTPGEYWLWRVPEVEVEIMTEAFLGRMEADARRKTRPGAVSTDPEKLYVKAHFALKKYLDLIVAEKKGASNVEQSP